ncbi:MAG: hypothetical protein ACRDH9_02420 [Actinomycetota bacterium]
MRETALVVEADSPLDNASSLGNVNRGTVRILIEGPDPAYLAGSFILDEKHWLVPGMEIPVILDPTRQSFDIDWDAVPGIEELVEANDPVLADPEGAQRKVVAALESAGIAGPNHLVGLPEGMRQLLQRGEGAREEGTPDRFQEAVKKASTQPAPPGNARAVVRISTTTASLVARHAEGGGGWNRTTRGKRTAVLAVTVPGRTPYAVLAGKFKNARDRGDIAGAGLPALVSSSDPDDVEILWGEVASVESQIGQRVSDALQGAQAEQQDLERGMSDLIQQAIAAGPPPGLGGPGAPGTPSPVAQEMMRENAKRALQFVSDPKMRKTMIEQYRAAGIDVDEEE